MKKNENRKGYKKTKVGWIPKDWDEYKVLDISIINVGKDLLEKSFLKVKTKTHTFPVYSNTVENRGLYGYYDFEEYDSDRLTIVGRGAGLGTAFSRNFGFGAIGRLLVVSPNNRKLFDVRFFAEYVNNKMRIYNESSGIPQLTGEGFGKYKVILPPLPEQEAIAEVLECWDRAILNYEKKIELKRNIKKGLMQRLLSSEQRLPGFSGKWKKIRLGQLGEFKTSSVDKKIVSGEKDALLVNYMDVYRSRFISKETAFQHITATAEEIKKSQIKKGDVLFTPSSETPEDIGHSAVVVEDIPGVLQSYHLVRLRVKNNQVLNFDFRAYVFNNFDILRIFARLSSGATRYTLSLSDFKRTQVFIPSNLEEQQAIATVLSKADEEIKFLEQKLTVLKDQKRFLLNNMVTGTIRLPRFVSKKKRTNVVTN